MVFACSVILPVNLISLLYDYEDVADLVLRTQAVHKQSECLLVSLG